MFTSTSRLFYLFFLVALIQYSVLMNYLVFWFLGFGTLWAGLNLFDDEILLIVTLIVGSGLVLIGLFSSPVVLQVAMEVALVASVFHVCMECVERGDRTS